MVRQGADKSTTATRDGQWRTVEAGSVRVHSYVNCLGGAGGDFVELRQTPGRHVGLTVADVSGHGPEAAPAREDVLQELSDMDETQRNEQPWLEHLNGRLYRTFEGDRFCAAVSVRFECPEENDKTMASVAVAGMPAPILFSAATGCVDRIGGGALPLGAMEEADYLPDTVHCDARAGDLMVIFTDGVSEAHLDSTSLFGDDRVERLVRSLAPCGAEALLRGLVASVHNFLGGAESNDDMTVAVIEFTHDRATHTKPCAA